MGEERGNYGVSKPYSHQNRLKEGITHSIGYGHLLFTLQESRKGSG